MKKTTRFLELKRIFSVLHGSRGCLWDKEQTHLSLIPYLKEEAGELITAIRRNNPVDMQEELGDILLQVMFHSQLASKEGGFNVEDVIEGLIKKLKRRHPHVFGRVRVRSSGEIVKNWKRIKSTERRKVKGVRDQKDKYR